MYYKIDELAALVNKTDKLAELVKNTKTYREGSLLCFSETWLTTSIQDANMELPGFSTVKAEMQTPPGSGREEDSKWCNPGHVNVKISICCQDIELLNVSLRPYYLLRADAEVVSAKYKHSTPRHFC